MTDKSKTGKQASIDGFAHEHIVVGVLMKKYHDVFFSDNPLSSYDLIIIRKLEDEEDIIRAQVKTAQKSISFTGGTRGGVDREYKSDVKKYVQSTKTSDVIIGIHPTNGNSFDLYFVPTILVENLNQQSISLNRIPFLKNNFTALENSKDSNFVLQIARENGLIE